MYIGKYIKLGKANMQTGQKQIRNRVLFCFCILIVAWFVVMTVKVYPIAADRHNFLQYSIPYSFREDWKVWGVAIVLTGFAVKKLYGFVNRISVIKAESDENFAEHQKKLFRFSFLLNCLAWGCVFFLFFPGTAMNDTINCMMSPVKASSMQPLIFELIVYWGLHIMEKLTGDIILAYAVLTAGQMLFCAFAAAYGIAWLYGRRIKLSVCYLVAILFAFSPITADYSVTLVKDSCFAFFFLLLLIQVYDILANKDQAMSAKQTIKLAVLMLLVTLFRTNGKVVTVFLLFLLLIAKGMDRKKIAAVGLLVFAVSRLNGAVVSHYNPESVAFREASGVLTQQMAAVLARGGNVTEEEVEFLNHVLPIELWKSQYAFSFVDSLKFHADFDNQYLNEHKMKYIKTWFSLLTKNFKIYVDAYFFHTYQLWNIASFDRSCVDYSQSIYTKINNNTADDRIWGQYLESIGLKNQSVYPEMVAKPLSDTFVRACELNFLISPGWMILVLVICIFFSLISKNWTALSFLFPPFILWLFFMAAVPLAGPYRYSFYLLVTLPYSILLTWKGMHEKRKERVKI